MPSQPFRLVLAVIVSPVIVCGFNTAFAGGTDLPPNIVLVLADDLGWGDVGVNGHPYIETPVLDGLAQRGARLTNFYADAPVCSPTRASLMTGRVPPRHGLTNVIETTDHETHLAARERLLPELLREQGYATACIGKWHLGEEAAYRPQRRGFDRFFGNLLGGFDFWRHDFVDGRHDLWSDDVPVRHDGRYATELLAEQAVAFIDQSRQQPFFLYLPLEAVHTSMGSQEKGTIQAPARLVEYYARKLGCATDDRRAQYAACVTAMDEAIGQVVSAVEALEGSRSTLIVFTSDNGPEPSWTGTGGPYRGTKHTLWEGGIRVPMLACWPGNIPAGSTLAVPGMTSDLFPTLLAAAGAGVPEELHVDGENLLPVLTGKAPADDARALCWSYIRDTLRLSREQAVRQGRWKWLNGELYDLDADPGETRNLSGEQPERAAALAAVFQTWLVQFPDEVARWSGRDPLRNDNRQRPGTRASSK